jgi:hypothetical protein
MKRLIYVLVLSALISTELVAYAGKHRQHPVDLSVGDLLQAHNVPRGPDALSSSVAEAVKFISYYGDTGGESPSFFERKVSVSIDGNAFKRHKAAPQGLSEHFDLSDGQGAYRAVVERGSQAEGVKRMAESDFAAVEFSIKTFGLVPILNQLSDPAAEIVYLGRTARGEDKFKVRDSAGSRVLYADHWHMIRRVEMGDKVIEYADYRPVEGVQLPFLQRLYVKGHLIYELVFTKIDLTPAFPAGYFSREALSLESVR